MRMSSFVVAASFAAAVLPAAGQTLKPGLWEMQSKVQGNAQMDQAMAEMQKQLSAMSPEQRSQMEAMMAARGVHMAPTTGGAMRMKVCMTPEMAERNDIPANRGDCTIGQRQRSGNTMTMAFTCTNPPSSGRTQVTFDGSGAFTSRTTVTTTTDGKPETMTLDGSGRWLSADCGNVKPIQPQR
jgi:hypothetical protein